MIFNLGNNKEQFTPFLNTKLQKRTFNKYYSTAYSDEGIGDRLKKVASMGQFETFTTLFENAPSKIPAKDAGEALIAAAVSSHKNIVTYLFHEMGPEISLAHKLKAFNTTPDHQIKVFLWASIGSEVKTKVMEKKDPIISNKCNF